jgi:hypothetical protein
MKNKILFQKIKGCQKIDKYLIPCLGRGWSKAIMVQKDRTSITQICHHDALESEKIAKTQIDQTLSQAS